MGDHFVLLVDRLLTESTLAAAIASRNQLVEAETKIDLSSPNLDFGDCKIVECRICQDEDADSNMETPCSCTGSLKYAHRRCVQRWCNEKGNTTCEICHQQFKPGYTAPPPLLRIGQIPMNLRGNWATSRRDLHGPRLVTVVSTDSNFLDSEYQDYPTSATNSVCYRTVLIVFMILLVLRHTLPAILTGTDGISFPPLLLLFLRIAGVVIPVYVTVRVVAAIQRPRLQQEPRESTSFDVNEEDEEVEHSTRD